MVFHIRWAKYIGVGPGQPMKYHRDNEIGTDKHPLAVTIQTANNANVYVNREGCFFRSAGG